MTKRGHFQWIAPHSSAHISLKKQVDSNPIDPPPLSILSSTSRPSFCPVLGFTFCGMSAAQFLFDVLKSHQKSLSWGNALVRPSGKRLFLIKWGGLLHCLYKVGWCITWLQTGMSLGTWIRCYKMILLQNGLIYIIGWKNGMHYKLVLLRWSFTTGWHWENSKGKKIREKCSDCKMVSFARLSLMRIRIGGRQFWAIANNKRCLLPIPPSLDKHPASSAVSLNLAESIDQTILFERPIPTLALEVEILMVSFQTFPAFWIGKATSLKPPGPSTSLACWVGGHPKMHPIQLCKGCKKKM